MTLDAGRVQKWLETNEKSREWLADRIGVSAALVSRMLGGKVPKTDTMLALARVMGCRVEDLVTPATAKRTD
jgi:DNA-binding Xre family transcriptional regulator